MSNRIVRKPFTASTLLLVAWVALLLPPAANAQDEPSAAPPAGPTRAEQETMAEIDALRQRIENLLDSLSPEVRETARARLAMLSTPVESTAIVAAGSSSVDLAAASTLDRESRAEDDARRVVLKGKERAPVPDAAVESESSEAVPADDATAASADVVSGTDFSYLPASRPRLQQLPSACSTLQHFDSDDDGMITARDRYWRHLYLWSDRDGDGEIAEIEVLSAYERGVRTIPVSLEGFTHADLPANEMREIEVDRHIVLDLFGNGFDSTARMGDDGILVVDATRIARGQGPELHDETGLALEGLQAFRSGLRLVSDEGDISPLDCP